MKKIILIISLALVSALSYAQPSGKQIAGAARGLDYFMPEGSAFDAKVPSPEKFFNFNIVDRMPEWAEVVNYMEALAAASERVSFKCFAYSFERRPVVQIAVTSPKNQARLEAIRQEHLLLTDPSKSVGLDLKSMPVVVNLAGSIHGYEFSGLLSMIFAAYYYSACTDKAVENLLDNTVVLITPSPSPDAVNLFAHNINYKTSLNHFHTPVSWEYTRQPGTRGDHYGFDPNRDFLALQTDITRNAVEMHRYWMPNVYVDVHEWNPAKFKHKYPQYTGFTLSKGNYPYIPDRNYKLNEEIFKYTDASLASIGEKTAFTGGGNYMVPKGSVYLSLNGTLSILHEHAGVYGHIRDFRAHGIHDLSYAVRTQVFASYGDVSGSFAIKDSLLSYQRDFWKDCASAAAADSLKACVFDDGGNKALGWMFIDILHRHGVEVYDNKGKSGVYVVPSNQKFYYLTKAVFEESKPKRLTEDGNWAQSDAFGINWKFVKDMPELGERVDGKPFPSGTLSYRKDAAAYCFSPKEFYVPRLINTLQLKGIEVKVAVKEFKGCKEGTLVIPVKGQSLTAEELKSVIEKECGECAVDASCLKTISEDCLESVRQPRVALITGSTASLWYLVDYHYGLFHSYTPAENINDLNFNDFNSMVFSGSPSLKREKAAQLREWIKSGNTLVLQSEAISKLDMIIGEKATYSADGAVAFNRRVRSLALRADIKDPDSPLVWGYETSTLPVMNLKETHMEVPESAKTILAWNKDPYISGGYVEGCLDGYNCQPIVSIIKYGEGAVVLIDPELFFRKYWFVGSRIYSNAFLFGDKL